MCLRFFCWHDYRELLHDDNFQESLSEIKEEPIPYFNQFSSQPKSFPSSSPVLKNIHSTLTTENPAALQSLKQEPDDDEPSAKPENRIPLQTSEGNDNIHGIIFEQKLV